MSYAGKVSINGTDYPIASSLYGTCSTSAATAAKVVTLANFDTLMAGVSVVVKFTYSNTASSPTLNVNNTGAKAIKTSGSGTPGTTVTRSWRAGSVVEFVYDGSAWIIEGDVTESIKTIETNLSSEVTRATNRENSINSSLTSSIADKEPKMLRFTNKSATFSSGNGITNFGYRAAVACTGVTSSMTAYVCFNGSNAGSGDYAPYCQTYNGGVYLYAAVSGTITVPKIICWRE